MGEYELGYDYVISEELLKQGAEARIRSGLFLGRPAIVKERFSKSYRHPVLDEHLNKTRMRNELKGISKAQQLGIDAPSVFFVDGAKPLIIMERIEGPTLREFLETKKLDLSKDEYEKLCEEIGIIVGKLVGRLHVGGLVHGDLTTSNILLRGAEISKAVIIDYGLCQQGKVTAEDKGVDLYVLERAITSTHTEAVNLFGSILEGYRSVGEKNGSVVVTKLDEIRLRGRKRDMTG